MHPWTSLVIVALHHGVVTAISVILGCLIVRTVQKQLGERFDLTVRLPKAQYGRWTALGFVMGIGAAFVHWALFRNSHSVLDAVVIGIAAVGCVAIAWTSVDGSYRRDPRALLAGAACLLILLLMLPDHWRHPKSVDWLFWYLLEHVVGTALIVVFPLPPLPPEEKGASPSAYEGEHVRAYDPESRSPEPKVYVPEPLD